MIPVKLTINFVNLSYSPFKATSPRLTSVRSSLRSPSSAFTASSSQPLTRALSFSSTDATARSQVTGSEQVCNKCFLHCRYSFLISKSIFCRFVFNLVRLG